MNETRRKPTTGGKRQIQFFRAPYWRRTSSIYLCYILEKDKFNFSVLHTGEEPVQFTCATYWRKTNFPVLHTGEGPLQFTLLYTGEVPVQFIRATYWRKTSSIYPCSTLEKDQFNTKAKYWKSTILMSILATKNGQMSGTGGKGDSRSHTCALESCRLGSPWSITLSNWKDIRVRQLGKDIP